MLPVRTFQTNFVWKLYEHVAYLYNQNPYNNFYKDSTDTSFLVVAYICIYTEHYYYVVIISEGIFENESIWRYTYICNGDEHFIIKVERKHEENDYRK